MQLLNMSDVGALVRSERRRQGLTQAELAERLHTGRDWVVRLEHGNPRLEAQMVLNALTSLGVPLVAGKPDHPDDNRSGESSEADPFAHLFDGLNRDA